MPRLRYLKKGNPLYEQPPSLSSNYDDDENEQDTEDFYRQRKGWWSTENIVASLSEEKIRILIERHRQNISLLENELVSRHISPKQHGYIIERLDQHETRRTNVRRSKGSTDRGRILQVLARQHLLESVKREIKTKWMEILKTYDSQRSNRETTED